MLIHFEVFSSSISLSVFPDITQTNSPFGAFSSKWIFASSKVPLNISSWSLVNSLHIATFLFPNPSFKVSIVSNILYGDSYIIIG